jgi:hypothetical protein
MEVKGDQVLKADYKPTIEVKLQKKLGRTSEILKEEKIICDSEEDFKNRMEKIENQLVNVDNSNEKLSRELYQKLLGVNEVL